MCVFRILKVLVPSASNKPSEHSRPLNHYSCLFFCILVIVFPPSILLCFFLPRCRLPYLLPTFLFYYMSLHFILFCFLPSFMYPFFGLYVFLYFFICGVSFLYFSILLPFYLLSVAYLPNYPNTYLFIYISTNAHTDAHT